MAGMYGCFKSRNSDSAAMASGPPDVLTNQEPAEVVEECSGKKKSKFQTFKKFFARKKRKEPAAPGADGLKASQSSDNVSKTSENNTLTRSEKEKGSGSKISLGNKALSHDSVFVSDSSEATEALGASQDSIHGKVKSLQLQLRQAIRLGSPPSIMCVKKADDGGTMSEDDGLPCSPPELTTLHTAMNQAQRDSSISLEGVDTDEDQLSCPASSRAVSPLVVPGDFSQPASPFGCLDNSAAKHKLGLRHKACNRRKPVRRLELKAEGDSVEKETLNTSTAGGASEEREQQEATGAVSVDELKPKVDKEEEKEEEEEEEEQPQRSRYSLSRDEEEEEEGEDESQAEQDVSPHGPDSSSPLDPRLSEEEAPDAQPLPSSKPSSRASSLDRPGASPEPPAGPTEYLLDPPGVAYGVEEKGVEGDLALSGEEDGVQESREEEEEEESSFLQEVLSSLKTPLASCSLGMETEDAVLQIEEDVKEREDVQVEEGEEVEEPAGYQAAPPAGSLLSDQTTEEEEATPSGQDVEEEEEKIEDDEAAEEGELVEEQVRQHDQREEGEKEEAEEGEKEEAEEGEKEEAEKGEKEEAEEGEKEEAEEVTPEEQDDTLTGRAVYQAEEDGGEERQEESEGEEEAIELEKEPEVEEVGREKREEEEVEVKEAKERVEEAEEAIEEERDSAEEVTEMFPDAAGEDVAVRLQEEEEAVGVVVGDDAVCTAQHTSDEDTPPEVEDAMVQESEAASKQSFGEERENGEEEMEEGHREQKPEREEDAEQPDEDVQQEGGETSQLDVEQEEKDQNEATEQVSSKPPPLSLPESHGETRPLESGSSSPSKTTTLHINLLSPSSEKTPSIFQQSPTEAHPRESEAPCGAVEQHAASTEEEEPADNVEVEEEEERQSAPEAEAAPPASVEEEEVNQPSSGSDKSKARFTVAPAWQRSLSVGEAEESSPPTSSPSSSGITEPGGVEVEAKTDLKVEAEPAKVEVVLSPGRVRSPGTSSVPSPSSSQPQTAPSTESSVSVEGNPDSPFGVRLRKTSAVHRFSSEEENTESPTEPPAQPTSCRVEQPISVKPSISQPISNKPALPKKPDVHGDGGGKNKRLSDPAAYRGVSGGSDSPSWISMAKQKQKIYKENSLEEITVRKEEPERKSSLPMYVSSAVSREHSNRTAESTGKVSPLELSKPSVEKETRRSLSPPTPVPPQPPKSQSLPSPVPPKPQLPSTTAKHPPHPTSPHTALSPTTPLKSPPCTSPTPPSKPATSPKTPQSSTLTSPPFSSRTPPEKSRAPGLSSQPPPASQRGPPPPASPQDEPPWMALAKKKAKAWSEMPQIVQ